METIPYICPSVKALQWTPGLMNPWALNSHRTEAKCPVERDRLADEEEKNTSREKERGRTASSRIMILPSPSHGHFLNYYYGHQLRLYGTISRSRYLEAMYLERGEHTGAGLGFEPQQSRLQLGHLREAASSLSK